MRLTKSVVTGLLATVAGVLPLSSASAHHCRWHYCGYHEGPVTGVVDAAGAVVTGALAIATAPVVLAADIVSAPLHTTEAYDYGPGYGDHSEYYGRGFERPRHRRHRYRDSAYCCSFGY